MRPVCTHPCLTKAKVIELPLEGAEVRASKVPRQHRYAHRARVAHFERAAAGRPSHDVVGLGVVKDVPQLEQEMISLKRELEKRDERCRELSAGIKEANLKIECEIAQSR